MVLAYHRFSHRPPPLPFFSVVCYPRVSVRFVVHPNLTDQSFRAANEREPEAMVRLQQQLKPATLKDCQTHFAEGQREKEAVDAAAAAAAATGGGGATNAATT